MRRFLLVLALLVPVALAGCPDPKDCSEDRRKAMVRDAVLDWYLYPDLVPDLSLSGYPSAEQLLAALVAPAVEQGLDRGWDALLTEAQFRQLMQGESVDFGFDLGVEVDGAGRVAHLRVLEVYETSPAALAGFARGDEILAIGSSPDSVLAVAGLWPGSISSLLYPGASANARTFSVLPRGAAEPVFRTATPGPYDLDPVPPHHVWGTTGYVQLRTFIEPAEAQLRAVFADFRAAGVQDVVVDLRYNGGGMVQTAIVLASLLGGDLADEVMFVQRFNDRHASENETFRFQAEPSAGTFRRIAFVTTRGSASASELVPHTLDPYRTASTIAFVGESTYGKPVGQVVFGLGCDTVMFLVAFRSENAAGDFGYFDGLPDASSHAPLCAAADDLGHDLGDPQEAMTAAAVWFAEHGECMPAASLRAGASPRTIPLARPGLPPALLVPGVE